MGRIAARPIGATSVDYTVEVDAAGPPPAAAATKPIGATSMDYAVEVDRPARQSAPPAPAKAAAGGAKTAPTAAPPAPAKPAGSGPVKAAAGTRCPKCNADVGGYAFCARCGTRIAQ